MLTARRRILFLCTGNSCRSQLAEAMLRHMAGDRFEVHSAGSRPAGYVHPIALITLERLGIPHEGLVSKSWHEVSHIRFDAVLTLCDDAAAEECPVWLGDAHRAHWGLPDPARHPGPAEEQLVLAGAVAQRLEFKIRGLSDIDWNDAAHVRQRLAELGEM